MIGDRARRRSGVSATGDIDDGAPKQRPVLAIEVAESSLASDRTIKGGLYARAGMSDYWIINLVDRVVEVYRDPSPDAAAPHGWAYQIAESHQSGAVISPPALPSALIAVSDLLP